MTFQELTLQDLPQVAPYLALETERLCDYTVGTMFLWRSYFHTQYAIDGDALFFRFRYPDGTDTYTVPLTNGDLQTALDKVAQYAVSVGEPLVFSCVSARQLEMLKGYFPDLKVRPDRDWFDYLYDAGKMQTFSGKKLHGQRNHLNRFQALYPDAVEEPITADNMGLCLEFLDAYAKEQEALAEETCGAMPDSARAELEIVRDTLQHYASYPLLGVCIRVEGQVIAFAIGSVKDDTLYEHIEKASRRYPGAYQKVASAFARLYAAPERPGVVYVNREDDMGDPSLRESKLSYHPCELVEKYTVWA